MRHTSGCPCSTSSPSSDSSPSSLSDMAAAVIKQSAGLPYNTTTATVRWSSRALQRGNLLAEMMVSSAVM